MENTIRLGVSACLLGRQVRYNGGHAHDRFLTDTLGRFVEYEPVCPEAECGLGVPREAVRLVGGPHSPRLVGRSSGADHTQRMLDWAGPRLDELERLDLCGFIFKSRSPSSGLWRVKVYDEAGQVRGQGSGLFAGLFVRRFPLLPVEEDGRLHDPLLREMFIEAVFCLKRWRETVAPGPTRRALIGFHTRHKLLLMSHSVEIYRRLGRLTANLEAAGIEDLAAGYLEQFMRALALKTTVKKNVNVLEHARGYFKKQLTRSEKQELGELIGAYAQGLVPLIVPITLLNHYVRKYEQPYLAEQYYLNPHPLELKLRNHA